MRVLGISLIVIASLPSLLPAQERVFRPVTVINRPDGFPAITDIPVVDASNAGLSGNELVLGVVVDGQARAYPINMLTGPTREILNDVLGGVAIAATW